MTVYSQRTKEHVVGTIRPINILELTTLGRNSFWHRTIPVWNSFPAAAIESKTVASFKSQLVD